MSRRPRFAGCCLLVSIPPFLVIESNVSHGFSHGLIDHPRLALNFTVHSCWSSSMFDFDELEDAEEVLKNHFDQFLTLLLLSAAPCCYTKICWYIFCGSDVGNVGSLPKPGAEQHPAGGHPKWASDLADLGGRPPEENWASHQNLLLYPWKLPRERTKVGANPSKVEVQHSSTNWFMMVLAKNYDVTNRGSLPKRFSGQQMKPGIFHKELGAGSPRFPVDPWQAHSFIIHRDDSRRIEW